MVLADNDRLDRRRRRHQLPARAGEAVGELRDQRLQMSAPAVALLDQVEAGEQGTGHDRARPRGKDVGTGAADQPLNDRCRRCNESPRGAGGLAERSHVHEARIGRQAEVREAAAALRSEHAEAMSVIDDQPGIETFGQCQQAVQRGEVTVHAEDRIGQNQLSLGRACREQPFERGQVAVRIPLAVGPLCLGQLRRVDQRGVIELVGKDRIATPDERRDDAEIGHVPSRKKQRVLEPGERRQSLLQRFVRCQVTAHQMRGAAADAPRPGARAGGLDQHRIVGQAEIIVAAKTDQLTAVDSRARTARRGQRAARAAQAILVKCGESGSEILEEKRVGHRKRSSGLKAPLCPKKRMVEFLR